VARGALILTATLALVVAVTIGSYSASGLSASSLSDLSADPSIRALYGAPFDLATAAGFTVWRAGQFLALVAALWALLATTRVLRGEEEAGRWDLLLTGPIPQDRLVVAHFAALGLACALEGAVVALAFVASGQPVAGAVLFGLGLGLVALAFSAVGAVTSQLVGQRRKAAGLAGLFVGVAFLVRMVADASQGGGWLRWLSPFGWLENLQPFGGNRLVALAPLVLAPVGLGALTLFLAGRRDVGEGIVRDAGTGRLRPALLQRPIGFSWRERRGGLVAWGGGLAVLGLVVGAITGTITDFLASNPSIERAARNADLGSLLSTAGFVATMDSFVALLIAFYVVSSLHVVCEDEDDGRLELVYAAPITRIEWLGAQVLISALIALALALVGAVGIWVGIVAGSATLSLRASLVGILNVLPLGALALGGAVFLYGVRPTLVVPVAGGALVVAYLMTFLGPALHLSHWMLDLSPFHHLALAPAQPVAWGSTVVMLAVAAVLVVAGSMAYAVRDLR
jgi:ABC-2 type transport system permease protein